MPFVRDVTETTVADFDRVIAVNLRSMVLCAKHVIPEMLRRGRGSIVNLGSISAFTGQEDDAGTSQYLYNITKAAAVQLAVSLGTRYAAKGIRVNAVCPGVTRTGILRGRMPDASEAEYRALMGEDRARFDPARPRRGSERGRVGHRLPVLRRRFLRHRHAHPCRRRVSRSLTKAGRPLSPPDLAPAS